jgi:hypothetical protein
VEFREDFPESNLEIHSEPDGNSTQENYTSRMGTVYVE